MSGDRLGPAAIALGAVLLAAPFALPADSVRWHDTDPTIEDNVTLIESEGYDIVTYGALSSRGQELYVRTLENGGSHRVPVGDGAPEFTYPTESELDESNVTERLTAGAVVVERPDGGTDLPPADEGAGHTRYELLQTATREPPFTSPQRLARLAAFALGLLTFGYGVNRVLPE